MVSMLVNKNDIEWDGEICITSFEENDIEEQLKNVVCNSLKCVLHIHFGCDYVGVMVLKPEGKLGCFSCYERQYNVNNLFSGERIFCSYKLSGQYLSDIEAGTLKSVIMALVDQLKDTKLQEYAYIIHYKNLNIERKRIRKVEDCKCCGSLIDDYAWNLNMEEEFFSSRNSFRVKDSVNIEKIKDTLYDKNAGLFQYIYKYYRSPYIPIICSEFNDVDSGRRIRSFGRSFKMEGVEASALLEGLERYSGMKPRKRKSIVHESYLDIAETSVNPEDFILHKRDDIEEFGLSKYDEKKAYNWVWAYSWKNKQPVLIPEQVAYFDVNKDTSEKRFIYDTSNGVALGGSRQEAILYGLYELIERDAFLLAWFNKYRPVKIDIHSIKNEKILETIRLVEFNGYRLHLFDITTENRVPAVWIVIENPNKDAKVRSYHAAGAHTNPYKAIEGGLVEAITSMPIYENILPKERGRAELLNADYSQVTRMEDHVLMYSVPESFEKLNYLFEDEKYMTIEELYPEWDEENHTDSLTKTLTDILDRISNYHDEILMVDQTNDLIEDLDLYCAKVIIPSMQNMYFGEQYKRLNTERIKTGAVLAGWRDTPIDEKDMNIVPHPFP